MGEVMSRKHFRAVAEALKDSKAPFDVCHKMAQTLAQFNTHFDRTKFMEACGH